VADRRKKEGFVRGAQKEAGGPESSRNCSLGSCERLPRIKRTGINTINLDAAADGRTATLQAPHALIIIISSRRANFHIAFFHFIVRGKIGDAKLRPADEQFVCNWRQQTAEKKRHVIIYDKKHASEIRLG